MDEKRVKLQNWMLLRDSADDLFEELDARIASIQQELKRTVRKKRKEELKGVLDIYITIKKQMTENVTFSSGQIQNLQESIRENIKKEQIKKFKKVKEES